jgi:hypothetical protein
MMPVSGGPSASTTALCRSSPRLAPH